MNRKLSLFVVFLPLVSVVLVLGFSFQGEIAFAQGDATVNPTMQLRLPLL